MDTSGCGQDDEVVTMQNHTIRIILLPQSQLLNGNTGTYSVICIPGSYEQCLTHCLRALFLLAEYPVRAT